MTAPLTSPEQLFIDCRKGLFLAAVRILHNTEDAEDCVQETALRMVRFWNCCRDQSTGHSWALSIVRHQAFDALRKRRAAKRDVMSCPSGQWNMTVRSHEGQILARLTLIRATARLTDTDREALALWAAGHRAVKEVGPAMHSREYRAIHRIRTLCRGIC